MITHAQRAGAQAEQARRAAIEEYRRANPHILHTLEGLDTCADSIDSKYNKNKDPYRIVSSDGVLFLVSQSFLRQSSVLWKRAQTVCEDEIVLEDPTFETAECIRGLLDVTYNRDVGTLKEDHVDCAMLVLRIIDLIDKYDFPSYTRSQCGWWLHQEWY